MKRTMKTKLFLSLLCSIGPIIWAAETMVILDEIGVQNIGVKTVEVEEMDFETTFFAIGRIEEIPANRAVVSSRISGRIVGLHVYEGDVVEKDQLLIEVESRQPGNPPPVIELKASRGGLVSESHARHGEPVEPNGELLHISDQSELWAVAKIPEQEAAKVKKGVVARIRIPSLGGDTITATFVRFGVTADRETGSLDAIFTIPNPAGHLRPGMRVEFSVVTDRRAGVMAIPRSAIQGDLAHRVVFVKDFELPNTYLRTSVQLGEKNDNYVEVLGGLFPGDDVVTKGSYSLSFVGPGSGMSLKDALDAAHGHEHNEDGSEIGADQKANQVEEDQEHAHGEAKDQRVLTGYAIGITLLFLIVLQQWWNQRKKRNA